MALESVEKSITAKHKDLAALFCLIIAVGVFIWKAPYGFGFEDESWYLTFSHRLFMGDAFITEDWHLAQFIGFLLYWPTKLYIILAGSTDGIILFFRYLFIVFQATVSAVIYWRLRNYGLFSIFAALIFYFNLAYFTFMSLNYYSMGLGFTVLAAVLMATAKKFSKILFYTAGLFLACATPNNPFLVLVYFIYSICMIAYEISKKRSTKISCLLGPSFSLKSWIWFTLGVGTIAILLFGFIFSRANIIDIIENLPMLFKDPEYQILSTGSGNQNVLSIYLSLLQLVRLNPFTNVPTYLFFSFILLFTCLFFDKKRLMHRKYFLTIASFIYFAYASSIAMSTTFPYYSTYLIPFALLGLLAYILSVKKNKQVFIFLWVLGFLYSLCLDISSAQGFYITSMGLLISGVASSIFIKDLIDELRQDHSSDNIRHKKSKSPITFKLKKQQILVTRLLVLILTSAVIIQISHEAYGTLNRSFNREYLAYDQSAAQMYGVSLKTEKKEKLDVMLESGPEKGIKTTAAFAKVYNGILNDLSGIKEAGDGPVYITALIPWFYLYLDMPYATGSTWCLTSSPFVSDTDGFRVEKQRLLDYCDLHDDRVPKYIYVPKVSERLYLYNLEAAKQIMAILEESFDFTTQEGDYGYILTVNGYRNPTE